MNEWVRRRSAGAPADLLQQPLQRRRERWAHQPHWMQAAAAPRTTPAPTARHLRHRSRRDSLRRHPGPSRCPTKTMEPALFHAPVAMRSASGVPCSDANRPAGQRTRPTRPATAAAPRRLVVPGAGGSSPSGHERPNAPARAPLVGPGVRRCAAPRPVGLRAAEPGPNPTRVPGHRRCPSMSSTAASEPSTRAAPSRAGAG